MLIALAHHGLVAISTTAWGPPRLQVSPIRHSPGLQAKTGPGPLVITAGPSGCKPHTCKPMAKSTIRHNSHHPVRIIRRGPAVGMDQPEPCGILPDTVNRYAEEKARHPARRMSRRGHPQQARSTGQGAIPRSTTEGSPQLPGACAGAISCAPSNISIYVHLTVTPEHTLHSTTYLSKAARHLLTRYEDPNPNTAWLAIDPVTCALIQGGHRRGNHLTFAQVGVTLSGQRLPVLRSSSRTPTPGTPNRVTHRVTHPVSAPAKPLHEGGYQRHEASRRDASGSPQASTSGTPPCVSRHSGGGATTREHDADTRIRSS